MKPPLPFVIPGLAALLLLAGCGAGPVRTMDPQVRAELRTATAQLKAAATSQNRSAAEAALQKLTSEVAAAQAAGQINPALAEPILLAANRVAQDVGTLAPPAPVTVTVSPTPIPYSQDQQWNQDQGNQYQGNQDQQGGGRGGHRHNRGDSYSQ